MLLQELDNPFYTEDQPESEAPLQIIERFGYKTKTEVFNGSVLQASGGQSLLAVLDGKVEVKGSDIEISDQDSKFLYKNVDTIRYKTGDHVKAGDIIGKVAPEGNQTVYYQKLEPDRSNKKDKDGNIKKSWTYVNVGFYFQRVEYTKQRLLSVILKHLEIKEDVQELLRMQSKKIYQKQQMKESQPFWEDLILRVPSPLNAMKQTF